MLRPMADSATPPALPDAPASAAHRPVGALRGLAFALLGLTGALGFYFGLSGLALPFLGDPGYAAGAARWVGPATGALQLVSAAALVRALSRKDMGGAVLAAAALLLANWIDLLLSGPGGDSGASGPWVRNGLLLALPLIAGTGAALARTRPLAAALVVTLPTLAGVLGVLAFAGMIAVYGF